MTDESVGDRDWKMFSDYKRHIAQTDSTYKTMLSGIDMRRIDCKDYTKALEVDSDINYYVRKGIYLTVMDYEIWGWFWFNTSMYALDFIEFNKQIYDIIECGV